MRWRDKNHNFARRKMSKQDIGIVDQLLMVRLMSEQKGVEALACTQSVCNHITAL